MADLYAVIGNPIAQSRSPQLHTAFARQLGHDIDYTALLSTPDLFERDVRAFAARGGKGMNVTAPFKQQAAQVCDTLSEGARAAAAVNTLVFADGRIHGENTDGAGLVSDIQDRLGYPLRGRRILLIGAGGAARGILLPLMQARPDSLLLVNRSLERAQALLADLPLPGVRVGPFAAAAQGEFDLILHATSAGLNAGQAPAVPWQPAPQALAYDLSYAAEPTPFLLQARARGVARRADGLGMLVGQAAESYRLWRGVRPHVQPVLDALLRHP